MTLFRKILGGAKQTAPTQKVQTEPESKDRQDIPKEPVLLKWYQFRLQLLFEAEDENPPWEELEGASVIRSYPHVFSDRDKRIELCETKKHRKFLRLTADLPIFDPEDREYGSWQSLYLLPDPEWKNYDAVYAMGGYKIGTVKGYKKLLNLPAFLEELSFETPDQEQESGKQR